MLSENVFSLSSVNSVYDNFITFQKNTFSNLLIFNNSAAFVDEIVSYQTKASSTDAVPLILFVEYTFLSEISTYLNNKNTNLNYILIGFDHEDQDSIGNFGNLFDFVNTRKFDEKFLINKITNEVNNRKKISTLKYELREFYEIGKSLSSEKDTVKLLEMIISSSIKLTSSDAGTIYLVIDKNTYNWTSVKDGDYNDKLLKFVISKNLSINIDLETYTSPITKDSIFGYSVLTGSPVRIEDAYKLDSTVEYRHNNYFDLYTGYITKSILTIPMKDHENNILGVIQLLNKKKNENEKIDYTNAESLNDIIPYNYSDEVIMSSLAGQAAVVLENNLLYTNTSILLDNLKKQNLELDILGKRILKAHEEERKRIAREIHDGPAQAIVNLSLRLELARKYLLDDSLEKGLHELDSIYANIKSTSKEIRTILYDLKPSYLENGLIKALENRLIIFEEASDLKVNFTFSGSDSAIEYYIASALYRIVQEALTNIQKHAHASNVIVDLRIYGNGVSIQINDDGIGFDAEDGHSKKQQSLTGGFGLSGLKERVELLKGRFDLQTAPGQGTNIMIYIPL